MTQPTEREIPTEFHSHPKKKKDRALLLSNYRERIYVNDFNINLRGYILKLIFFIPFTSAWPSSF